MDEVKDKMKGLLKKVNNPFTSSSSSKFKGQGRVLGSATSPSPSSSCSSKNTISQRAPLPATRSIPRSNPTTIPPPNPPTNGFDPFNPLLSSGARCPDNGGPTAATFDCPVCARPFPSPDDVAAHLDLCLSQDNSGANPEIRNDVIDHVATYMSGRPVEGSVEVLLKLLRNVIAQPENEKFRRIRMGNPKISEAVGAVEGGVELLEFVGFKIGEEGGDMWATLQLPSEEHIVLIKEAVSLLEGWKSDTPRAEPLAKSDCEPLPVGLESSAEPKKINRKVQVFFPVSESVAEKIDVPDSFYMLSSEEIKKDAIQRKKKIEESQLLVPKSFREKQALAGRKKYKATVIRIQFPDGVVLQGVFLPWETTTALYEFVSSALKEPSLEFELLQPAVPKSCVIPRFPKAGGRSPTLEDAKLVPSALLRFRPMETESVVFTGLSNEVLETSDPLTSMAAIS